MGSNDIFNRRRQERQARKEDIKKQKPDRWLIVCEGTKTEPNYFDGAVKAFNQEFEEKHRLKVDIIGKGMNTVSLVKSVEELQDKIDDYRQKELPYGKIFVVFDKDSFAPALFNEAIDMCCRSGYIPLWSNQAIEYWFLLHFHYIDVGMSRTVYADKINEFFKERGLKYRYQKNDEDIYKKLCQYGSLENAIKSARQVHKIHQNDSPAKSESCTTVYHFFIELDERRKELE